MAMTRRTVGVLSALSLFFACSAGPGPATAAAPAPKQDAAPAQESRMPGKIEIIEAEQLQGILAQGGCVALGKVRKVETFNQGTRGARVRIHVEVEKQLHGSLPGQVSFLAWGGPDTATVGQQLLLAVKPPVPQFPDVVLLSFHPVPEGKGEEAVRAQQEALAKVSQAK